jgi:hypothetical protein
MAVARGVPSDTDVPRPGLGADAASLQVVLVAISDSAARPSFPTFVAATEGDLPWQGAEVGRERNGKL